MSVLIDATNTPAAWSQRAREAQTPWEACGWSRDSQRARFSKILGELKPWPGSSLLDYGCGTGALYAHNPATFSGVRYVGFDWSLGMLDRARRECGEREGVCEFTSMPRDGETWDYVVCCGTFNLADQWSKAQTWALMRMLWNRTRRAMAVSLYCGHDPACIRYAPSEVAVTAGVLAHKFTVERGYLPNDLLVVMRR